MLLAPDNQPAKQTGALFSADTAFALLCQKAAAAAAAVRGHITIENRRLAQDTTIRINGAAEAGRQPQ